MAPRVFLTNHHVVSDPDIARRSFVILNDETEFHGALSMSQRGAGRQLPEARGGENQSTKNRKI